MEIFVNFFNRFPKLSLTITSIIVIWAIVGITDSPEPAMKQTVVNKPVLVLPTLTLKEKVENAAFNIADPALQYFTAYIHFETFLEKYKSAAKMVKEGKASTDKETIKAAVSLEKQLIAHQVKWFPKLRKAYADFAAEKLWEQDVEVEISGAKNSVITFIAGMFAANKNIKGAEEIVHSQMKLLRFKKAQYKWYKYDDATYYNIQPAADNQLVMY